MLGKHNLAFKGGTSLSKAYGLIERFSEDIDLILIGAFLLRHVEPWKNVAIQQDILNKEANTRSEMFLVTRSFLLSFLTSHRGSLRSIRCFIDDDPQTVKIAYLNSFAICNPSGNQIEIGVLLGKGSGHHTLCRSGIR